MKNMFGNRMPNFKEKENVPIIPAGTMIGPYRIISYEDSGGMADVYKARHTNLGFYVAIKFIRKDKFPPASLQTMIKRFHQEAIIMANLSHNNIVRVIHFDTIEGIPYFVMDYLEGGSLSKRLGKRMSYQKAARLLLPIADALYCAHSHPEKIIHRDVKPANILFTKKDGKGVPKLTDFGIAKVLESDKTLTPLGAIIGTPQYMSPEAGKGIQEG